MKVERAAETASIAAAKTTANCTVRRVLSERKDRIGSIIHRHRRRRWPKPDREACAMLIQRDCLLHRPVRSAQIRMPDNYPSGGIGSVSKLDDPLRIGACSPGRIGDDNEGAHLVVDV